MNCSECAHSGQCMTEHDTSTNFPKGEDCYEFIRKSSATKSVQDRTCIHLVHNVLTFDQDAMRESIQQLLNEIPASQHAALGDALVQLGGMVFREQYQSGIEGMRLYPSNKEIKRLARNARGDK